MKKIVLIFWIILVVLEIGKQLLLSYNDNKFLYHWFNFPYQFCETPIYVLPIILINKNKKMQNALISYMSTFVLFAGLAILLIPITILCSNVFLNVRQLVGHGIQFIVGLFLFVWNRKNVTIKHFVHAIYVFLIAVAIAIFLNTLIGYGFNQEINMFYIAKDYPSAILIVKDIKPHVPWIIFLICYVVGFIGCAFGVYLAETQIYKLICKKYENQNNLQESH